MTRYLKFFLLVLCFLFSSSTYAHEIKLYDDDDDDGDCGCEESCWFVQGDWLFWSVRSSCLDYVVPYDGTNAIGKVRAIEPSYDHGFRVAVGKTCDEAAYSLRYTHYKTDELDFSIDGAAGDFAGTRIVAAYTVLTQGAILHSQAEWSLDYDIIHLQSKYEVKLDDCMVLYGFGGPKYAMVQQDFSVLHSNSLVLNGGATSLDEIRSKLDLKGLGGGFGLGGRYTLFGCFDLFGSFGYDLFLADVEREFRYRTSVNGGAAFTTRADLKEDCWRPISVVCMDFGAEWRRCFRCVQFSLALGYESSHWINSPSFLTHMNEGGEIAFDRHAEDLGFDGFFVRGGLTF